MASINFIMFFWFKSLPNMVLKTKLSLGTVEYRDSAIWVPDAEGLSFSTTSRMNSFISFQYFRLMLPEESTMKAISTNVEQPSVAAGDLITV